ncbi:hypothetical protein HanXRQr2_Chr16g0748421 [Helianthus annuus]|uniref:Uncharacterized protein n=1 Tax=Helianthus annuus TaxID=4232 RepID=A0A9K3DR01_HELAN|nr:hypothetical protein HanXRQr2_Chr16g0748421 [Helianthus annuus]
MKKARFQTFWIQMQQNKPGTKMAFYSNSYNNVSINPEAYQFT